MAKKGKKTILKKTRFYLLFFFYNPDYCQKPDLYPPGAPDALLAGAVEVSPGSPGEGPAPLPEGQHAADGVVEAVLLDVGVLLGFPLVGQPVERVQ